MLLYIESVTHARKFMSAARRCARVKPVIVVKSGRHDESARAARSHTGALAGSDAVYDAAFRRAGLLRVFQIDDLFDALEASVERHRVYGDRLAIVTNGGGAGVSRDRSPDRRRRSPRGVRPQTIEPLERSPAAQLEQRQSRRHHRRCRAERYRAALEALLADDNAEAILVMNCPVAVANPAAAADAVISVVEAAQDQASMKPVFASWLGEAAVGDARKHFDDAGVPPYSTPEHAVTAMMQLVAACARKSC